MRHHFRPECVLLLAGCLLAGLSGCGWTPRDEYLTKQQVMVRPQAGDGSQLASMWESKRSRQTASIRRSMAGAASTPDRER